MESDFTMPESEFEIITIKPRWSPLNMVSQGSETAKKNSILYQLNEQYLRKGWLFKGEIVWGKKNDFAVVRLKPPSQSSQPGQYIPGGG